MKPTLKDLAVYLELHNGFGKPKINFKDLYKLFPHFEFEATKKYGVFANFGEAYEAKNYNMLVSDGKETCLLVYKEYGDSDKNLACLIHMNID